ncbi:LysR family transcriptional regulator [Ructibacterium gallinarum]|uniref:LysR family transcriptional regulator n=1 Tax=Ructibacterium gallinarum TaxID=2779355 RepID=A0A9D5R8U4_9FIRM|nr:LysR family transcriptional regulator [Ructibacterium gallinarum]MBE5040332.1 LysR family transcriptional regulator [Ructibacterium gallinarum]
MNLRHLKIFLTVAECQNMHRAAEKLYIAQSTVSQAIREIEEEYDVKLFERLSRRIYLTETGELLLSYARHILSSAEEMEHALRHRSQSPILRLGGSVTVGTCLLDGIIDHIQQTLPGAQLYITVDNTSSIESFLLTNELDAAVVEGVISSPDLMQLPVFEDELVIAAGKNHPLSALPKVTLSDLENQRLISRESGSAERNQFEKILRQNGIHMVRLWQCTNTEAIKNAVIHGRGLAILSRLLLQNELERGQIKILPLEDICVKRTIHLVYHKNKYISPVMEALQQACNALSGQCANT